MTSVVKHTLTPCWLLFNCKVLINGNGNSSLFFNGFDCFVFVFRGRPSWKIVSTSVNLKIDALFIPTTIKISLENKFAINWVVSKSIHILICNCTKIGWNELILFLKEIILQKTKQPTYRLNMVYFRFSSVYLTRSVNIGKTIRQL